MITVIVGTKTVTFIADTETMEELADHADDFQRRELIVIEALHEKWEMVAPEVVGALTDAPIFATNVEYHDDGCCMLTSDSQVCWYPNYAVKDWTAELEAGQVVFTLA